MWSVSSGQDEERIFPSVGEGTLVSSSVMADTSASSNGTLLAEPRKKTRSSRNKHDSGPYETDEDYASPENDPEEESTLEMGDEDGGTSLEDNVTGSFMEESTLEMGDEDGETSLEDNVTCSFAEDSTLEISGKDGEISLEDSLTSPFTEDSTLEICNQDGETSLEDKGTSQDAQEMTPFSRHAEPSAPEQEDTKGESPYSRQVQGIYRRFAKPPASIVTSAAVVCNVIREDADLPEELDASNTTVPKTDARTDMTTEVSASAELGYTPENMEIMTPDPRLSPLVRRLHPASTPFRMNEPASGTISRHIAFTRRVKHNLRSSPDKRREHLSRKKETKSLASDEENYIREYGDESMLCTESPPLLGGHFSPQLSSTPARKRISTPRNRMTLPLSPLGVSSVKVMFGRLAENTVSSEVPLTNSEYLNPMHETSSAFLGATEADEANLAEDSVDPEDAETTGIPSLNRLESDSQLSGFPSRAPLLVNPPLRSAFLSPPNVRKRKNLNFATDSEIRFYERTDSPDVFIGEKRTIRIRSPAAISPRSAEERSFIGYSPPAEPAPFSSWSELPLYSPWSSRSADKRLPGRLAQRPTLLGQVLSVLGLLLWLPFVPFWVIFVIVMFLVCRPVPRGTSSFSFLDDAYTLTEHDGTKPGRKFLRGRRH